MPFWSNWAFAFSIEISFLGFNLKVLQTGCMAGKAKAGQTDLILGSQDYQPDNNREREGFNKYPLVGLFFEGEEGCNFQRQTRFF